MEDLVEEPVTAAEEYLLYWAWEGVVARLDSLNLGLCKGGESYGRYCTVRAIEFMLTWNPQA
jgi:hypothetical protein